MAPKSANGVLSDREMELLRAYIHCVKSKPEVDMEKFTSLCGFGNATSARSNLSRMLAKVAGDQDINGSASSAKATDGGEAAQETPAGKKKGGGRKRANADADDDDADASPKKKRASPTKCKGKATAEGDSPIKKETDEGAGEDA